MLLLTIIESIESNPLLAGSKSDRASERAKRASERVSRDGFRLWAEGARRRDRLGFRVRVCYPHSG